MSPAALSSHTVDFITSALLPAPAMQNCCWLCFCYVFFVVGGGVFFVMLRKCKYLLKACIVGT